MQISAAIAMIAVALMLGFCGWLFLFRTGHILHLAHHTHRNSPRWVQNWPGHRIIFKPWYPTYLRFGGIFAWLVALSLLAMAVLNVAR
jgi:hypothetical protein